MAQTYKMMLGTSGKQWEQLTVKDDGTMMLYFHGTDRSVTQQVTAVTEGEWKGWLRSEKGSMWPGIDSGRWQPMEANYEQQTTTDVTDVVTPEPTTDVTEVAEEVEPMEPTEQTEVVVTTTEAQITQMQTPCAERFAREDIPQPSTTPTPRPRRQRKPRVEHQEPAIRHQPSALEHQPSDIDRHQPSSTLKAIGMVAAATVALFVIYETGLLIPLGLIGLATGGILK